MKKLGILIALFSVFACNDGDFDVPAFEFSQTVAGCDDQILYVANSSKTEVLALSINPAQFTTTVGKMEYSISASASASTIKATYRIFKEGISTTYFCQAIPPLSPTVVKEMIAESGNVIIKTTEVLNDKDVVTGYKYEISFTELLFNDGTERVYFETFSFGTVTGSL